VDRGEADAGDGGDARGWARLHAVGMRGASWLRAHAWARLHAAARKVAGRLWSWHRAVRFTNPCDRFEGGG